MINRRLPLVSIVGLIALAAAVGPAWGAIYNLRVAPTTRYMPDGSLVVMWGYALASYDIGNGPVIGDNVVQVPGPRLMVPAGQGLTVNLTNELNVAASIIIPGQMGDSPQVTRNPDGRIRSFVPETPAGGQATYNWSNIKPGTYLYHSGTHPAVQVQMGLYGAVTKNAVEAGAENPAQAYPGIIYNEEVLIIYSEIDPALHNAVAGAIYGTPAYPSTINYHPKYFLVNGVAADAAAPLDTVVAGTNVLVRFLNAGLKDHAPEILGSHLSVVAEDGNPYPYPRKHYSLLLAAGKTLDGLFSPSTADYPIFDRRAYRTNVATVQGALHTYISVEASPPPTPTPEGYKTATPTPVGYRTPTPTPEGYETPTPTSTATPTPTVTPTPFCFLIDSGDFNGDGTSDIAVFRPSAGLWAVRGITRAYFGSSGDVPVPGDYDGNNTTDLGIFRSSSGLWAIRGVSRAYLGISSDYPVPSDYNGDNRTDVAIYRPSIGLWSIRGLGMIYFGADTDTPISGDYNGDGTSEVAIFRAESGLWAIRQLSRTYFGSAADTVVPGDYDGDGAWNIGIFRPSTGLWDIRGVTTAYFGGTADKPVPADYTGDSRDDIGIFRDSSGLWEIRGVSQVYYGRSGDVPITR